MLETVFPVKNDPEAMHAAAQGILAVSAALTAEGTAHTVVWADNHEAAAEDIGNEEDFRRMKERLLSAAAGTGGDGTGTLFQRQYPEARFQRVIMFSPHPYSDVPLPAAFRPATLVLPPFIPYAGSEPGIRVISLDPADACIVI